MTNTSVYRFGRVLAVYNMSVPGGLPSALVNNALWLPRGHWATLEQIARPYLSDLARDAVNAIIGDGIDLPRYLTPVQQLDVWLGYYHQIASMDDLLASVQDAADYAADVARSAQEVAP